MPACKDCIYLFDSTCTALPHWERCPIKACERAILNREGDRIKENDNILEVGCGHWYFPRTLIRQKKANWFGVDGRKRIHLRKGMYAANVIDMPFEENFFGGGCAFATFEHWKEKGGNQIDGIKEIHRVLKPGGWFIVDCPIHEHGAEEFISDDIDKILSYIDTDSWNIETEEWRKDYDPLPPYEAWYYKGKTLENIKEAAFTHSKQKVPSAWLFTILLEKK